MPRQIKTIEGHLDEANRWVISKTGLSLNKGELELFFREKLGRLKRKHLDARFESYEIEDCLNALEIVGGMGQSKGSKKS